VSQAKLSSWEVDWKVYGTMNFPFGWVLELVHLLVVIIIEYCPSCSAALSNHRFMMVQLRIEMNRNLDLARPYHLRCILSIDSDFLVGWQTSGELCGRVASVVAMCISVKSVREVLLLEFRKRLRWMFAFAHVWKIKMPWGGSYLVLPLIVVRFVIRLITRFRPRRPAI